MDEKLAIIDLGTNTFHLLIAEKKSGKFEILHQERVAVKLGLGGINRNIIQEDAIARALSTLQKFKTTIQIFGVEKTHAIGTSALRNAQNGVQVASAIRDHLAIEINIISGDEEAKLIYQGVRAALTLSNEPSLIMDIGGGSVEFIIATEKEIYWKKSIEIGVLRLLEKFNPSDPISSEDIRQLDHFFESSLSVLGESIAVHQPQTLVGSSGTFDTLSDIYCAKHKIEKQNTAETPLTLESFYDTYNEVIRKTRAERMLIPGMINLRVDMIVVGCCLVRFLIEKYNLKKIKVSSYSLKEGALISLT